MVSFFKDFLALAALSGFSVAALCWMDVAARLV
jgi:hypothetical protein